MNYEIIKDEKILKDFIKWLPDLLDDETYYVCLFARSKYANLGEVKHINTDKAQLKRFTTAKHRLFDKLRQLECPIGAYKQKENVVPQEALAVYINPNPRSHRIATRKGLIRLANLMGNECKNYNVHQEIMSEIQQSKSRMLHIDFDFDLDKYEYDADDILRNILDTKINKNAINVLETRGGYHFLVDVNKVEKEFQKTWYNEIKRIQQAYSSDYEGHGDCMIPVPGCYQGGFIPKFI